MKEFSKEGGRRGAARSTRHRRRLTAVLTAPDAPVAALTLLLLDRVLLGPEPLASEIASIPVRKEQEERDWEMKREKYGTGGIHYKVTLHREVCCLYSFYLVDG